MTEEVFEQLGALDQNTADFPETAQCRGKFEAARGEPLYLKAGIEGVAEIVELRAELRSIQSI